MHQDDPGNKGIGAGSFASYREKGQKYVSRTLLIHHHFQCPVSESETCDTTTAMIIENEPKCDGGREEIWEDEDFLERMF